MLITVLPIVLSRRHLIITKPAQAYSRDQQIQAHECSVLTIDCSASMPSMQCPYLHSDLRNSAIKDSQRYLGVL